MEPNQSKQKITEKIDCSFKLKIIVCLVLSCIVVMVFFAINRALDEKKHREYKIIEDIYLINSVESVIVENDIISINGYAFIQGENAFDNKISVFLRNVDTKEEVWLKVQEVERQDVDSYFNSEYSYIKSGFFAYTKVKKINIDESYEIIINIDKIEKNSDNTVSRITVTTNRYIYNSELYTHNPIDFKIPYIDNKLGLIYEVIANGQLCSNQEDEGIYVYNYKRKLFWITTERFKFDEKGSAYIIYHLHTSHRDKLQEKQTQYKYDFLDFDFVDYEYVEETTAPYRIAIRDLPNDYPITYVKTGVYDLVNDESIWIDDFHLDNIISN